MTIADTLRHLGLSAPDPRSDVELVRRFTSARDEMAFAELLRRHGPIVYGVCRRVVGNTPDADDVFQAVFLTLARKAGDLRDPGAVGGWLFGVAVRIANRVRTMNARRGSRREPTRGLEDLPGRVAGSPDPDMLAAIDAELAALPDQYRAAFVACELNGRSRSEAARDLGWPEGTVATRLAKARELLASRLRKRGVTLAAGAFASVAVAVSPAMASGTLAAVREFLAVGTASTVAPAAQHLSDEAVKVMNTTSVKWVTAAVVLTLTFTAGGAALLAGGPGEKRPPVREPIKAPVPKDLATEWREGKPIELKDGDRITGVAYSGDGKFIAIAQDKRVEVLKADSRERHFALEFADEGTIATVAFSPSGDKLAVTRKDEVTIRPLDLKTLGETWEMKGFDPHQVAWFSDKDGDHLVVTNGVETRHRSPDEKEEGFRGWAVFKHQPCVLAGVPGKGSWLMQFDNEREEQGTVNFWVWNPADIKQCLKLTGHTYRPECAAVSGDGKVIVTGDGAGHVVVRDGEKFEKKADVAFDGIGVMAVALTADGKTTAVLGVTAHTPKNAIPGGKPDTKNVTTDLSVSVFDTAELTASGKTPPRPILSWKTDKPLPGIHRGPMSLVFSPDGKTLLAAFSDPYPGVDRGLDGADPKGKSMGVKVWELIPKK